MVFFLYICCVLTLRFLLLPPLSFAGLCRRATRVIRRANFSPLNALPRRMPCVAPAHNVLTTRTSPSPAVASRTRWVWGVLCGLPTKKKFISFSFTSSVPFYHYIEPLPSLTDPSPPQPPCQICVKKNFGFRAILTNNVGVTSTGSRVVRYSAATCAESASHGSQRATPHTHRVTLFFLTQACRQQHVALVGQYRAFAVPERQLL